MFGTLSVDFPAGPSDSLETDCAFLKVVAAMVAKEVSSLQ